MTNKGKHTALYKINNNVYIKTSKVINYIVIILYFSHARAHTHARTHAHRRNIRRGERVKIMEAESRKQKSKSLVVLFVEVSF